MPGLRLRISNVRLEQRLGMMVPDVLCHAEDMSGELAPSELIVEVAVTHFVGPEKLDKIVSLNLPCLEFDAKRMRANVSLTKDMLLQLLRRPPPGAVRWLHHPHLQSKVAAVREALRLKFEAQEAALERERQQRAKQLEAERQAEREREFLRQQRQQVERQLGVMGKFGLLAAYVEALKRNRRLTDEDPWEGGDFPVYQRNFDRLGARAWADSNMQRLLLTLAAIREGGAEAVPHLRSPVVALLDRATGASVHALKPFVPLLLKAIKKHWRSHADEWQRDTVRRVAHQVKASIDAGEPYFSRDSALDEPLLMLFPELADALVSGAPGTRAYMESVRESVRAAKRKADAEAEEEMLRQHFEAIEVALAPAKPRQWTRGGGVPIHQWSMYGKLESMRPRDAQLIMGAYAAREAQQSVADFVRLMKLTDREAVCEVLEVLNTVYLLN